MTTIRTGRKLFIAAGAALGLATPVVAAAQDVSLNYERLSSLEEPLATDIGGTTLVLTGLLDGSWTQDLQGNDASDGRLIGNFELGALTQLSNRWRVGLRYFGQYATDELSETGAARGYTDNVGLSVGGFWGAALVGNVSGVVREQTRRLRGAGNAFLAFDDALGGLDEWSMGYTGRFGPWVAGALVDRRGKFDLGAMYQRPTGDRDYRVTVRFVSGAYRPAGGQSPADTRAFTAVGEFVYGSMSVDLGAGYERFLRQGPDFDRWFVSSGVRWKTGVTSVSFEGHYGRIEDEDEVSAAFGAQYDIARGLSANFGLNYARAQLRLDGSEFVGTKRTSAIASMRYSF